MHKEIDKYPKKQPSRGEKSIIYYKIVQTKINSDLYMEITAIKERWIEKILIEWLKVWEPTTEGNRSCYEILKEEIKSIIECN